jgi:hypothetical protein
MLEELDSVSFTCHFIEVLNAENCSQNHCSQSLLLADSIASDLMGRFLTSLLYIAPA